MTPRSHIRVIHTGCKVNLYLRVGAHRPDGYHELDTFFLPLTAPCDTLEITPGAPDGGKPTRPGAQERAQPARLQSENGLTEYPTGSPPSSENITAQRLVVHCDTPGIDERRNTLTKAYALFAEATGFAPALGVTLRKGVPHGAGLGGGSANAAGLLRYLQECLCAQGGAPLPPEALQQLAARVGADVPFFLLGEPAAATGIGERLVLRSNPFKGYTLVLLCPELRISTAWAFAALDEKRGEAHARGGSAHRGKFENVPAKNLTTSLHRATTPLAHGTCLENDFMEVVFEAFPELSQLYRELLEKGAQAAGLSGTGSSLFGLFADAGAADAAARTLSANGSRVYVQTV